MDRFFWLVWEVGLWLCRAVVVSADPQFNHSIILQEGRSVEIWYLDTFSKNFLKMENPRLLLWVLFISILGAKP